MPRSSAKLRWFALALALVGATAGGAAAIVLGTGTIKFELRLPNADGTAFEATTDTVKIGEFMNRANCLCPDAADNDCTTPTCATGVQQVYLRDRASGGPARTFRVSRFFNAATGLFSTGNGTSRRASFNEAANLGQTYPL